MEKSWGRPWAWTLHNRAIKPRTIMIICAVLPTFRILRMVAFTASVVPGLASGQDDWPVVFTAGGDQVQVFAPQPESIDGYRFTSRSAVSLKRASNNEPVIGAIWATGVLEVDRTSRLGKLISFQVTDARFPGMDDTDELLSFRQTLSEEMPKHAGPISIDWLVAALENEKEGIVEYANAPPEIIYRERPGVLVFVDGDPIHEPMPNGAGRFERVVNTPFLMLRSEGEGYHLYGSGMWFKSKDLEGPWVREYQVPRELRAITARVDSTSAISDRAPDGSVVIPEIVVRTQPAVLLDLDGSPNLKPLPGSGLLYATNTTKDLFLDVASQEYYLLASGRWFATRDPATGPWTFRSSNQLPPDFARIPEGSAKDGALAHVSGTDAAIEAVRDASIPQTARIDRSTTTVEVEYDGDPQFEQIEGTGVELALNASTTVLRIDGRYHVLDNAIWFNGTSPHGPWTVSTEAPSQVEDIPPSSSAYNTRYVEVYDHTPEVVYVGYTPGYLGTYVQHGSLIYGTGYYYQPFPRRWRPRPFTWAMHMYYDPWVGWGPGVGWGWSWYYPNWYGWGWGPYRPGGWGWGWCGPYGYYPPVVHHHHHYYGHRPSLSTPGRTVNSGTGATGGRSAGTDLYAGREREGVYATRVNESASIRSPQTPTRDNRPAADHFTDREGTIYRGDGDRLERYNAGKWDCVPPSKETAPRVPAAPTPRPTAPATRPAERPATRPAQPATRPVDPQRIREDRSRGRQRMNDFQHHRQQPVRSSPPPQRQTPAARPGGSRPSAAPSRAPSRQPSRPAPQNRGSGRP